ncbi:hypothetical protein [Desulfosporosinus nitroreducens]|uniref:Uncharacterized protein n=1 Tax=Desulfosporosinus nitroreducens TaxID=2018668 RepID=A0ABT8QVH4_9FIRM|nr:hypothetical protein [Desulfosporosinus nitroreducens]MDO0824043.1 hypothetical protein [Desulfosporosinus nitroreducens]
MYKAQAPNNKVIREKAIIKAIEETIETHGHPFFFQYHHGLFINIPTNDFQVSKIGNYGGLNFYHGEAMPITLSQNYVSIEPVKTPDNLNRDLKACFLIRQECTKEVLGWLCWE